MGLLQRVINESAQSRANFVVSLALASHPKDATAVLALRFNADRRLGQTMHGRKLRVLARPVRLVLVLDVEARADARRRRE